MGDNKPRELQAELLITSFLIKNNFKVTKPTFDEDGADLLILDGIAEKSTKFLKIQSKLRTIDDKKGSSVDVPIDYVTDNFILFLYVNRPCKDEVLYTFFAEDIKLWNENHKGYRLNITENSILLHADKIFSGKVVGKIQERLVAQPLKNYTTVIVDGIFLEKAIDATRNLYAEIWPEKSFQKPSLQKVIHEILLYNPFKHAKNDINCVVFMSSHHGLENVLDLPDPRSQVDDMKDIQLKLWKTDDLIAFQVLEQLERIFMSENIVLVADDIIYEKPLNDLEAKGVELVLMKMHGDSGSRLYTNFRWGDISYPIGKALGLSGEEL